MKEDTETEDTNTVELSDRDRGALLYLLGAEIGRLRALEDNETSSEMITNNEINFYKNLAFRLNQTV